MSLGIGHERVAAVVRHVQPLVTVGNPGISALHAVDQMAVPGAGGGPQPERSVNMYPGSVVMRQRNQLSERVEGADVEVASLQQDDGRSTRGFGEGLLQGSDR